MMEGDSGMGVSSAPEDNLVPSIIVLQPLSPQVMDGAAALPDAEPGDLLLRGAEELVDGDEGIWFQPCNYFNKWLEFIPRDAGGGFVASYDFVPGKIDRNHLPDRAERDPENPNRAVFTDSGNECVHYHFVAGLAWQSGSGLEFVIPFKGSGHSVARGWNTTRLRQRWVGGPRDGQPMPAPANLYRLTTTQRKNKKGQWYVISVGAPVPLTSAEGREIVGDPARAYVMARSLGQAIESGQKVVGADLEADAGADDAEGAADAGAEM